MTTGMAWCPVSNIVIIKKQKVTNGAAWCPVSHGVSPKAVFLIWSKRQKQIQIFLKTQKIFHNYIKKILHVTNVKKKFMCFNINMINLSLDELKLVAESRNIRDYEKANLKRI